MRHEFAISKPLIIGSWVETTCGVGEHPTSNRLIEFVELPRNLCSTGGGLDFLPVLLAKFG